MPALPRKNSLSYKLRHAVRHPNRIFPYFAMTWRNYWYARTSRDPVEQHRRYIEAYGRSGMNLAVGSDSEQHWLEFGRTQFDYLRQHGLQPQDQVLEIGCGNLRLGWRLTEFLEAGHYTGLDISPTMLDEARRRISERGLEAKRPNLFLVDKIDYSFLPAEKFDWINSYAVFTQTPYQTIMSMLGAAAPLLKPGGRFDFTYFECAGKPYVFRNINFYYPRGMIAAAIAPTGLRAEWVTDWPTADEQVKVRLTKPPVST